MFSRAKKDVMYDLLKHEDVNWRAFNLQTAKVVYQQSTLSQSRIRALVLDDTIQTPFWQEEGRSLQSL